MLKLEKNGSVIILLNFLTFIICVILGLSTEIDFILLLTLFFFEQLSLYHLSFGLNDRKVFKYNILSQILLLLLLFPFGFLMGGIKIAVIFFVLQLISILISVFLNKIYSKYLYLLNKLNFRPFFANVLNIVSMFSFYVFSGGLFMSTNPEILPWFFGFCFLLIIFNFVVLGNIYLLPTNKINSKLLVLYGITLSPAIVALVAIFSYAFFDVETNNAITDFSLQAIESFYILIVLILFFAYHLKTGLSKVKIFVYNSISIFLNSLLFMYLLLFDTLGLGPDGGLVLLGPILVIIFIFFINSVYGIYAYLMEQANINPILLNLLNLMLVLIIYLIDVYKLNSGLEYSFRYYIPIFYLILLLSNLVGLKILTKYTNQK